MIDTRFFNNKGPFSLQEIMDAIDILEIDETIDLSQTIKTVGPLDQADKDTISFLDNPKYSKSFTESKAGFCITDRKYKDRAPEGMTVIHSNAPYYAFAQVANLFFTHDSDGDIAPSAHIHPSAKIGKNCTIGENSVIGANVEIGEGCHVHNNCTITHSILGSHVTILPGARIGQDGFGFAFHQGQHHRVPQLGRVIIGDNVEIGANSTIDRGASSDTIIGEGSKIDNLVQIGHNVDIGPHCIIVAQTGIAGSTTIGAYSVIGGQVGIAGHLKIGSQVQIAAQSGVMKDIADGETVGGSPAVPILQFHRQTIAVKKLINSTT